MKKNISERCVVTGLGMINAIGNDVNTSWNNVLAGKCGIAKVKSVNTDGCYANLGAEVDCAELENYKGVDRVSQLCLKATDEAVADSGLDMKKEDAGRVGVIMGSCVGGVRSVENYVNNGEKAEDIRKMTISSIANNVANKLGAEGVVTNVGNACAASTISIEYACELIREGVGDVFIVGGSDVFAAVPFAGFHALHALAEHPCTPFNKMDGITLGEGSGVLVIESYEHAQKRGAKIYCDVLAGGCTSDAVHITSPDPKEQIVAMRTALKNSGIEPRQIGYVNAHGTGTHKNDESEFYSMHTIYDNTGADLAVSSTKGQVGHCLGAAGSIESIYTIKALTENTIAPTIGYEDADLEILKERAGNINFVPNKPLKKELNYVMNNNYAFGGSNASVIFSKNAGSVKETSNDDPVYLTGIGIVSPLGNGKDNYITQIKSGKMVEGKSVVSVIGQGDWDKYGIKMGFYRKLDKFACMQVISGRDAMADGKLTITEENSEDCGMIIGTGDGPISTVYDFQKNITANGNKSGSAFNFPNTVYNAAGGFLSINTGMHGYNVTVTNGSQSGLQSACYAYNEIKQSHAKIMLATGNDENNAIMEKWYTQLGEVSDSTAKLYNGNGMTIADGSTSVLLENAETADVRGAEKYAVMAGYGMSHATTVYGKIAGTEGGLKSAIAKALADAKVNASEIDAIYGFGNGIPEVDNIEKTVYGADFAKIPVHNVRLYTGDARSASANLSLAHAALTLHGDIAGNEKAFAFENGEVSEITSDTKLYKTVLVTAASEGGSYTAIVLKKA